MTEDWTQEWQEGTIKTADLEEGARWMRARPDSVKALMKRFPPACLVRAKPGVTLRCPAPGATGIVTSYHEHGPDCEACADFPEGLVGVREYPDADLIHHCRADQLEVVGFHKGMTAERVAALLVD